MSTLLDHKTTLAYLAYLGYPDDQRTALQITRPRKVERRKGKVTRNVFLCYVCGAAGSGKTSLLRAFAGKPYRAAYEPTSKMLSVVNSVAIDGSEKYLVVSFLILCSHTLLHTHYWTASRIWIQVRSGDASKFKENGPGRRHCICPRLKRYQLLLLH